MQLNSTLTSFPLFKDNDAVTLQITVSKKDFSVIVISKIVCIIITLKIVISSHNIEYNEWTYNIYVHPKICT